MARKALIVWGGWDGHEPDKIANLFEEILKGEGFEVELSNSLDSFKNYEKLKTLSLIVPIWTMDAITPEQRGPVVKAVGEDGVGLAGCHGGMCDAFRNDTDWQFMTGGQWVAHPGNDGVKYMVKIGDLSHPVTAGIADFEVCSEQYYLHVDPAVQVLAYCEFPTPGAGGPHEKNPCKMPQVWTKWWGEGKVFYSALGHHADVIDHGPAREIIRRGFLWAAK